MCRDPAIIDQNPIQLGGNVVGRILSIRPSVETPSESEVIKFTRIKTIIEVIHRVIPLIVPPNLLFGGSNNIKITKDYPGFVAGKRLDILPKFFSINMVNSPINKSCKEVMPLLNSTNFTMNELVGYMQDSDRENIRVPAH